ncbi:GNAT family N-acetyltransferase [Paracoccus sp. DMF-8]|uniref:GNAT family N-acetyltransferase n=1 Tax=Paracoccus sp. DMF-8 TaxID=3019445 RepID=UPI0023E7FD2D|nr:GNAT family N-acetyltransferase [Paracoccus sp. DMF-8]MDF3605535.1 GNAT family N-acetyltransferase [Paracoccus sp. DMF-8]
MRVTLGRPVAGDTPAISLAMMEPEVAGWLHSFPFPYSRTRCDDRFNGAESWDYAVRVDGRFAGLVIAAPELGCWIDRRYQGSGIATRAATCALSRLFLTGANTAHGRFLSDNDRMRGVLHRLGFVRDASIPQEQLRPGLGLMTLSIEDFVRAQPFDIASERVRITGVAADDLPMLYDIAALRDVAPHLTFFTPGMSVAEFARILRGFCGVPPFWCSLRVDGQIIGAIGLESREGAAVGGAANQLILHGFIAPTASGIGLGREALLAFVTEIQDRFGAQMIHAEVFENDQPAQKLVTGAGFVPEGDPFTLTSASRSAPGRRYLLRL